MNLTEDFDISVLKKYGVVRTPANDYEDDGNIYESYLYDGTVPITYFKDGDTVYLMINFSDLPDIFYEDYSEFPSYFDADKFSGVPGDSINPTEVKKLLDRAKADIDDFRNSKKETDVEKDEYFKKALEYNIAVLSLVNDFIEEHYNEVMTSKYLDMIKEKYQSLISLCKMLNNLANDPNASEFTALARHLKRDFDHPENDPIYESIKMAINN